MGKVTTLAKNTINLEFDRETGEYYIMWKPVVIGAGKTEHEALEDLREAAHFGVDTLINLKLKDIKKGEIKWAISG
jgi:predicted RNase H-like HicB family nuclease